MAILSASWQESHSPYYTLAEGQPIPRADTITQISTGSGGAHVLLSSTQLLEQLAHFSRERIPERVVHAKASGAYGYFEVTDDVSDVTDADFLTGIGKKTDVLCRISTVGPERGSADTVRDFRGFAVKLKTEEGNQDFVMNNQPVFFVRNPVKFPSLNRSHKRHPATNSVDADMFWDFHVHSPESIHALMFLFGDRGLPKSVRHVNAYTGNTYKFTKADGTYSYVRVHFVSDQKIEVLSDAQGATLAGTVPDNHILDLQKAIKDERFPSWTVYIQVMKPEEVASAPFSVFDMTKIWPKAQYPRRRVGKMVLNRNPRNWFADIEQAAFSPSNMVPGIEASPDPMLQARMFAYPDAARYRLGANYQFLPTNAAKAHVYCPTERDGAMNFTHNYEDDPNYVGAGLRPMRYKDTLAEKQAERQLNGHKQTNGFHAAKKAQTADMVLEASLPVVSHTIVTDDDFEQPRVLWSRVMAEQEGCQERFVHNLAAHVAGVKSSELRRQVFDLFSRVDLKLGVRLQGATEKEVKA